MGPWQGVKRVRPMRGEPWAAHSKWVISLLDRPHQEAQRLLQSGAPVYLAVNPVEFHGPHLSLHNDALLSRGLTEALHARLQRKHDWPLLWGGDLELGVEPAPGPGSRHTPFRVAVGRVEEACRALVELGARRVVLMTFHGNPFHSLALGAGVALLAKAKVPALVPMNLLLQAMLNVDVADYAPAYAHLPAADRERLLPALPSDFHAGFFETSLALHFAPQTVDPTYGELPPCPAFAPDPGMLAAARGARALGKRQLAAELELAAIGKGWQTLRPFPGYTGEPAKATAAAGAFFAEKILELWAPRTEAVLIRGETPPAPIMGWLKTASLGGAITA